MIGTVSSEVSVIIVRDVRICFRTEPAVGSEQEKQYKQGQYPGMYMAFCSLNRVINLHE
jgi:hypothetical protein